jgi:hypothetical protein
MRAVGVLVGLEHGQNRLLLRRGDRVHRMPAGREILKHARGPALTPAPRTALTEFEVRARAAVIPAVRDRPVDQSQQRHLRGRLDAPRDPATQCLAAIDGQRGIAALT